MRIISGTHRGRRIHAPRGDRTRPILDQQKEALFNVLREQLPCVGVVDVFAGSGGLGLEALSRGAEHATFVERGRTAVQALRRNVEELGFGERATVLAHDALRLDPSRLHGFALVFLDPPFPLYRDRSEAVHDLLGRCLGAEGFEPSGRAMLRVPADADVPPWPAGVVEADRRPAGESVMFLLRRAAGTDA